MGTRKETDRDPVNGSLVKLPKSLRQLVTSRKRKEGYVSYCVARIPGGKRAALEVLNLFADSEPDAEAILQTATELPQGLLHSSLEEILEKAGIGAEDFLALLTRLMVRLGIQTAALTVAAAYPHIMDASVQRAMDPEKGTDERRYHFENSKFIQPKGGIRIAVQQNNANGSNTPAGPGEAEAFDRTARSVVRSLPSAD